MKTRKIIAYLLVLVMLLGVLAGCGKKNKKPTTTQDDAYDPYEEYEDYEDYEAPASEEATEPTKPNQPTAPPSQPTTPPKPTAPTKPPSEPDCEHVYKEWIMAATCTTEGAKMQRCEKCGYIQSSQKIDMLPHNNEWMTEKAATCEEEGIKYQQCKDCKEIFVYIMTEKADHTPDFTGLRCKDCNAMIPLS